MNDNKNENRNIKKYASKWSFANIYLNENYL